jgi:hypothetical protein
METNPHENSIAAAGTQGHPARRQGVNMLQCCYFHNASVSLSMQPLDEYLLSENMRPAIATLSIHVPSPFSTTDPKLGAK